jgi:hypothetical protein
MWIVPYHRATLFYEINWLWIVTLEETVVCWPHFKITVKWCITSFTANTCGLSFNKYIHSYFFYVTTYFVCCLFHIRCLCGLCVQWQHSINSRYWERTILRRSCQGIWYSSRINGEAACSLSSVQSSVRIVWQDWKIILFLADPASPCKYIQICALHELVGRNCLITVQ